jgi:hypothetical protein
MLAVAGARDEDRRAFLPARLDHLERDRRRCGGGKDERHYHRRSLSRRRLGSSRAGLERR